MRKKRIIATLLSLLTVFTAVSFGGLEDVTAATNKAQMTSDDFSSDEIDSQKWSVTGGVELNSQGGALKIKNGTFSQMVGWKGLRDENLNENGVGNGLSGEYSIEFTVSALDADWVALYLGEKQPSIGFAQLNENDYGSVLVMSDTAIEHYVGQGKKEGKTCSWKDVALQADGTRYCIKVEAHCGCESSADGVLHDRAKHSVDVYIALEPQYGKANYGEKVATIENVYTQGYFGFGSMNSGVAAFSEITVRDGDGKKLYEPTDLSGDFDMIEYITTSGSAAYYDCEWRVWGNAATGAAETFTCEPSAYVAMNGEGTLSSRYAFVKTDGVYSQYDVEFTLGLQELAGKEFAVALQQEETPTTVLRFVQTQDGYAVKDTNEKQINLPASVFKMTMQVKQDQTADIYVNGTYAGGLRLGTITGNLTFVSQSEQTVNVITYKSWFYSEKSSSAPSVSTDFSLLDNNDGKSYVNPMEFLYVGSVKRYKGYNELAFSNAGRDSMVATRYPYGEYVVKFDLIDITQGSENNILVFSFAKETYNETFKTVPTIIFVPRGYDGTTVGYANVEALNGLKFTNADGSTATSARMEKNIFNDLSLVNYKKNQVALNVMFVVRNRTITLYYKYSNQPDSEFTKPRVICNDVDTYGYFSIGGNNKANFSVKNLSITNLEF